MSNQDKKQIPNLQVITYLDDCWSAQYEKNGKVIHIGFFRSGIEAYRAYVQTIIESGQDATKEKERLEKLEKLEILFKKSPQNPPQT